MTYYYKRQVTPVNYIELGELPTFRNGDVAMTTAIITAMANIPGRVEYTEPSPIIEDVWSDGRNVKYSDVVGYKPGALSIPSHPMKSGKLWYYAVGSCSTAGVAGAYSHNIVEADTLPNLGFHCEMEHATTAENVIVDLVGATNDDIVLTFGQDAPTELSANFKVSLSISGNNITRSTALDFKGNYLPGQFTASLIYNTTATNFTILSGTVTVKNTVELDKANSKFPTSASPLKREYEVALEGLLTKRTLFDVPDDPRDYSSSKMTFALKVYRGASSAADFQRFSFTSLRMDKLMSEKIDDNEYRWKANILLHNAGARNATTSAGKLTVNIEDDLSGKHYEG